MNIPNDYLGPNKFVVDLSKLSNGQLIARRSYFKYQVLSNYLEELVIGSFYDEVTQHVIAIEQEMKRRGLL